MGRQIETTVSFGGVIRRRASVHLDTQSLQVSGRPRIEVAFADIASIAIDDGRLSLSTPGGLLLIELGDQANAWAEKIRTPPSRAKKLGLKAGSSVALSGLDDPTLKDEIERAGARIVTLQPSVDFIFLGVSSPEELSHVPALAQKLAPNGALWVVRGKGRGAAVSEGAVRTAARGAGLVDVKVVSFSDTQSADKFVIPLAERARPAPGSAPTARRQAKKATAKKAPTRKATARKATARKVR